MHVEAFLGSWFKATAQIGKAEALLSYPIFCLNFSLHGTRDIHEKLTGVKGSYQDTIQAIKIAVSHGKRVASNFVLTSENSDSRILTETVSKLSDLGCKEMTLTRFIPTGIGSDALFLGTDRKTFISAISTLKQKTTENGMDFLLANSTPVCLVPDNIIEMCNRCSFGFDKFYVDVNGNLLVCGMNRLVHGNIVNSSLADVLTESHLYKRFLKGEHIPKECQECDDLDICGGGCRAAAASSAGLLWGVDPLTFSDE